MSTSRPTSRTPTCISRISRAASTRTRRVKALARTAGFLRSELVASPRPVLGAAAAFRLRRLDRSRHAAVAADRRRRGGGQEARRVTQVRIPRRPIDGVLLLDKPVGLSSNAALQRAKRLYPRGEGRAHRHARSARLGPAAAVLRRGDQIRAAPARRAQALHGDRALRRRHRQPATRKARSATRVRWPSNLPNSRPRSRASSGASRRSRRRTRRSSSRAAPTTNTRVPGRRSRACRVDVEIHALRARRVEPAGRRARRRLAARARTSACWPRTSARRSAVVRTSRRCDGRRPAAFGLTDAVPLGGPRKHERRGLPAALLRPVATLVADLAVLAVDATDALRFRQGQAVPAPGRVDGIARCSAATVSSGSPTVAEGVAQPRRVVVERPAAAGQAA